jgi:hypothetical protein
VQTVLPNYHLLTKPTGAAVSTFFLSKENLYPTREGPLMTEASLETYIDLLMESSPGSKTAELRASLKKDSMSFGVPLNFNPYDKVDK